MGGFFLNSKEGIKICYDRGYGNVIRKHEEESYTRPVNYGNNID